MFLVADYQAPNFAEEHFMLLLATLWSLTCLSLLVYLCIKRRHKKTKKMSVSEIVISVICVTFSALPLVTYRTYKTVVYPEQLVFYQEKNDERTPPIFWDAFVEHVQPIEKKNIHKIQLPLSFYQVTEPPFPIIRLSIIDRTTKNAGEEAAEELILYQKDYTSEEYIISPLKPSEFAFPPLYNVQGKTLGFRFSSPDTQEPLAPVFYRTIQDTNPDAYIIIDGIQYDYAELPEELAIAVFGYR